jgi:hypothetical protein
MKPIKSANTNLGFSPRNDSIFSQNPFYNNLREKQDRITWSKVKPLLLVMIWPLSNILIKTETTIGLTFAGIAGSFNDNQDSNRKYISNPNEEPVELNRSSFYWGLLLFFVLAVLFSSYFFN